VGDDYVPKVWLEWLFDPEGLLAIAKFECQVVGIGKLTKLSACDWWLEGLRVHPQFEGKRIAPRLHKYLLEFWGRNCSGTFCFATVSNREPVKHLAQVNGFQIVGEYSTFKFPLRNTSPIKVAHYP
jgi:GNAT superfamily N-acetyltransferase